MPSTIVLDRTGDIRRRYDGYHDGEDAELERDVRELLDTLISKRFAGKEEPHGAR